MYRSILDLLPTSSKYLGSNDKYCQPYIIYLQFYFYFIILTACYPLFYHLNVNTNIIQIKYIFDLYHNNNFINLKHRQTHI